MTEGQVELDVSCETASGCTLPVYDITHSSPVDDTQVFIHLLHYLYSDNYPSTQVCPQHPSFCTSALRVGINLSAENY